MLNVSNVSVVFSNRKLFENVNINFMSGNCYGIIGANGAGKSTFLKVLSGEIDSSTGQVQLEKGMRMSVLQQDQHKFDDKTVLQTVISGHTELAAIMEEKDALYSKADFTEADGYRAADLEEKFAEMNGWEAEADAQKFLNGLKLEDTDYSKLMRDVAASDKVKVLLAQALFGDPDVLLLDEPTNNLDFQAIKWLENFLADFEKTVIVVSHDRHFLNNICSHIVDIDFQKVQLYVGNYDFWRESSQLAQRMLNDSNAKKEEQIKELEAFIARFSANASKSKQATSRKKLLEKITLDDIKPSSRKYPYIHIPVTGNVGNDLVEVKGLNKEVEGEVILKDISFKLEGGDKTVFMSKNDLAISTLFDILSGEVEADAGEIKWGITVTKDYLPKDNSSYFNMNDFNLVDWLRQYAIEDQSEQYLRGFLGKMLFSGEEPLKKVKVLSGGEKVRLMFSKLMLSNSNTLILYQPTNHLDLESIQSVNEGIERYEGNVLFSSHDYSFIETIATKVVELTPNGAFVYHGDINEYLNDEQVQERVKKMYEVN
ncbi:MAG: ABC-F family ATP-binding cassette domain-containing protein [Mycoplasmatales bacterium]